MARLSTHILRAVLVAAFLFLGPGAIHAKGRFSHMYDSDADGRISAAERETLLAFYAGTGGDSSWNKHDGWKGPPGSECRWFGITCNHEHVIKIELGENNLKGTLPDLSALVALDYLDLRRNQLGGSLAALEKLPSLGGANVSVNLFGGRLPNFAQLHSLETFYASHNQLSGEIPPLRGLTKLENFAVDENQLSGDVPALDGLTRLATLNLSSNRLSGSLPSLTGLVSLTSIDVSDNQLSGALPALNDATKLRSIRVDQNRLGGSVPDVPTPNDLDRGASRLCPNLFAATSNEQWDRATGAAPWYGQCTPPPIQIATSNAVPGRAAGIDCTQAASKVEKTICADPELVASDRRMTALFAELQKESPAEKNALRDAQRQWLHQRDACDESSCIADAYRTRVGDLLSAMPSLSNKAPISAQTADALMAVFAGMTPDDLQNATTDDNREALEQASCRYFERSPHEAAELFRSFFGSSRDGWQPLCRDIDITKDVPATKEFLAALEQASAPGKCYGTIMHGTFRAQRIMQILAAVDANPDIAGYERSAAQRYDGMHYRPDLAHWAQQGLWEKRVYAQVERTRTRARDGLRDFYLQHFQLTQERAGQVADYYVQRLLDVYILDHSGFSSTLSYASMCLDKSDLDRYLADGVLPSKECPYHEFADESKEAVLRRLLGLAIVDDYPLDTVKRLIADGAAVDPPAKEYENPDSPLMMAAARTDVIEALLSAGADANHGNWFGKTPLMYTIAERNDSGVGALLRAGAKVDATTAPLDPYCSDLKAGNRTALMYAAWHGNAQIVHALLEAHADSNAKDSNGQTAIDYVEKNTDVDTDERSSMRAALERGS